MAFVLPPLLPLIPWDWVQGAADSLPTSAGDSLASTMAGAALSDLAAVATLVGWAVVPLVAGTVLLQRRDA